MRIGSLALAALLAAAPVALAACENEPPKTALSYTEDSRRAYEAALAEFKAHNWMEAQTLFREVKRKYAYSKYAGLAELRIADADYEQEKFSDAIREYKDFARTHQGSDPEDVAYARGRIAEATYAEIPESFLLPAAEERDQASVVDAYKEIKDYLSDYPRAKESAHIHELLDQVKARLVRHELYVARFYLRKDNYEAAVARVQYALLHYGSAAAAGDARDGGGSGATGATSASGATAFTPSSVLEADALLLLGQLYLRMHKWPEARQAFESIVARFKSAPVAVDARRYLDFLRERGA
jgi:outer membrane protein assembly factor BamD